MKGQEQINQYNSFNGKKEQDILDYFTDKVIHCVKCKEDLPADPSFKEDPISNSLSISLTRLDDSRIHAVPYLVCVCKYENSVLKLLAQV